MAHRKKGKKKKKEAPGVPVNSFADIAFLLIVFFVIASTLSQITGVVTASIDLIGFELENHISLADDRMIIELPSPMVSSCDLDLSRMVSGSSFGMLPLESIEDIALVEDSMYIVAQEQLIRVAQEMGLLEEAATIASRNVTMAVHTILGRRIPVTVTYLGHDEISPWDVNSDQISSSFQKSRNHP